MIRNVTAKLQHFRPPTALEFPPLLLISECLLFYCARTHPHSLILRNGKLTDNKESVLSEYTEQKKLKRKLRVQIGPKIYSSVYWSQTGVLFVVIP